MAFCCRGRLRLQALVLGWVLCSVLGQQQRFRVRPSNTSVIEGNTAVLRCEVDHQVGQLQWAKEGFAMGYARPMPGYPRYRLLGDPGSGVHDLEITNVTLDDDGRFQCQVSPNKGQAAIRADAYLIVLMKPRSIRLRATVNGVSSSDIVQVAQGDPVTLTCDVTGARPAAGIEWQRDGRPLEAGDRPVVVAGPGGGRVEDSSASMTLRPSKDDNGVSYSCLADHPAIQPSERHLYNSTVTLSVLYAPGAPKISGYSPGEVLRMGEQRTLTCFSEGGNPPAQLLWTKNGRPIGHAYRATRRGGSATYTFIADQSDLRAIYRCRASSQVHPQPMVDQVETIVHFGPQRVTVTGTAVARAGDTVHMICVTSDSSPPANITWIAGGRTMTNTTWTAMPAADGGWVSVSNMSLTVPTGSDQDLQLACYTQNPAIDQSRTGTATVTVLHAPQPPAILGYQPDEVLQAGERVTLSCLVRGGNPRPRLTWYSGDRPLVGRPQTAGRDTLSLLTLTVTAADNGRRLTCRSRSQAALRPRDVSATLRVSFPPSDLEIWVSPNRLEAGGEALLTCQSRPSLPAAHLTWWTRGQKVKDQIQSTETFPAGDNGGHVTRVTLRRTLNWTDNGAKFLCQAEVQDLTGTLKKAHTLDVQYAPFFSPDALDVTIARGHPLSLKLTPRANPAVLSYAWSRDGVPLTSDDVRVTLSAGVMNVTSVRREDAGWYHLEAVNTLGSATARVHVDVLYPPEIIKTSSVTAVSRGEDTILACTAEANPLRADMFHWSRLGHSLANVSVSFANGTSLLKIPNVGPASVGHFDCSVENKLGYDKTQFAVVIKEAARVLRSARFAKAAARLGETAHVACRARGVPDVNFSWSRHDDVIDTTVSGSKYRLERKQVNLVTWASILVINDVSVSDYGPYNCTAANRLGTDSQTVQLVLPSVPDPPLDLRVLNVSSQAVTLAWTPAFDGGFIQGFRFRYSKTGSSEELVLDGEPNSARFTIGGLRPDTSYGFTVAGYNQLGVGRFTHPPVMARTSGTPPVGYVTDRDDSASVSYPRLVVGLASLCGVIVLLLVNALLISCCYFRRKQKLRQHADSEERMKSESAKMCENETGSTLSARSAFDNFVEENASKGDDCNLLSSMERNTAHSVFPRSVFVFQAGANDVIEMTSQPRPLLRRNSADVDKSYGYNHLVTSATFRDTLSGSDHTFTPSPDVISCDVTPAAGRQSWTMPRNSQKQKSRQKLVSFEDDVWPSSNSAQGRDDIQRL